MAAGSTQSKLILVSLEEIVLLIFSGKEEMDKH